MNILSLFDGMSCGMIAAERAGLIIDNYYASEIDKYSQIVSEKNYPNIIRLGDVTRWGCWDIDWASIDLLIGGSPCQGFSFAGKQLAFDDPRSKLFFVYVDILNHIKKYNPKVKFLLENVKMKKDHLDVITDLLGVEPVLINSALVSAQNRQRYYWCNWYVEQPEDKNIFWSDVMISGASDCLVYTKKSFDWIFKSKTRIKKYVEYSKLSNVKMQMIEASHSKGYSNQRCFGIKDGDKVRYIHPVECERLQTVPDNYTNNVSKTQRYKMLGNGWTVDVIAHIFKRMNKE